MDEQATRNSFLPVIRYHPAGSLVFSTAFHHLPRHPHALQRWLV